jgi:hypothetical protein
MSFSSDISKFADKAKLSNERAAVAVCSKVTSLVIDKTPVLSGRLRGNWFASIDSYNDSTSEDRTGSDALSDGLSKAQKASGHIFTLSNNLNYAYRIEFLGHSKVKAPNGMARVSVAEVANSLK